MPKQLVVKHHQPHKPWVLAILVVALFIVAVWGAFVYGEWRAGFDRSAAASMRGTIGDLNQQNTQLQEQITAMQREAEVDRSARLQVQQSLESLQGKVAGLQEELQFYKGIVSPNAAEEGLRVQSLKFAGGGAPRLYHYHLVLVQVRTREFKVSGRVSIKIYGAQDGKPVILDAASLVPKGSPNAAFNFAFQYFQNLEGDTLLPEGFQPGRVEITILENGNNPVRQNFPWQSISS